LATFFDKPSQPGVVAGSGLRLIDDNGEPYLSVFADKDPEFVLGRKGDPSVRLRASSSGSKFELMDSMGSPQVSIEVIGTLRVISLNIGECKNALVLRVQDNDRSVTLFNASDKSGTGLTSTLDSNSMWVSSPGSTKRPSIELVGGREASEFLLRDPESALGTFLRTRFSESTMMSCRDDKGVTRIELGQESGVPRFDQHAR
jgi:hypothetical protein